jgi:uncharacterized protein (TIGR02266 family)
MSEKKQVLIICRSAAGQMYLGVVLNRIWYAPALAKTLEDALRLAQTNSFSVVLFDGDVSELELRPSIAQLKNDPALKELPLVVFMTDNNAATNESLLAQGCAAVLTKPIDMAILYGVLQRLSGQPRTTPRIPVKMRVGIEEGTPAKELSGINLSEGGIYLRTIAPLPEGTVIHVKFTLPHDTQAIELAAEVVRTLPLSVQLETDPGMGLQFIDPPENTILRIRNYVQWEMTGDLEWKPGI